VILKKEEARKGDAKTSITQTSVDSGRKPNKSTNYNTQYLLSGQVPPDHKGGFEEVLGAMLAHIQS